MSSLPESNIPVNRRQRRAALAHARHTSVPELAQLEIAYGRINRSLVSRKDCLAADPGITMTRRVYEGSLPLVRHLEEARIFHGVFKKAIGLLPPDQLKAVSRDDVYDTKIKGVSLDDIEKMPIEMADPEVAGVNKFVKTPHLPLDIVDLFTKLTPQQQTARAAILFLPAYEYIHGENTVPPGLRPLRDRLRAYLDHYSAAYTGDQNGFEISLSRIAVAWVGLVLSEAVGIYIPAKLGILPCSVEKLYLAGDGHPVLARKSDIWKKVRDAYRSESLPMHLREYQHYDAKSDDEVSQYLGEHYKRELSADYRGSWQSASLTKQIGSLDKVKGHFFSDVRSAGNGAVVVPTPDHPVVSEVIATAHNDRNNTTFRQTQIFIARLRNGEHLTIEVNKDGDFYGAPAVLQSEIMYVEGLLARDIIGPVASVLNRKYAKPIIVDYRPKVVEAKQKVRDIEPVEVELDDLPKKPKKRTKAPFWAKFRTSVPEVPQVEERVKPVHKVYYDREQIAASLGKRTSEKDVDGVVEVLQRFESGGKRIKDLVGGHTEDLFSLRFNGGRRILLVRINTGEFVFETVETRQTLEKHIYH